MGEGGGKLVGGSTETLRVFQLLGPCVLPGKISNLHRIHGIFCEVGGGGRSQKPWL